MRQGDGRVVPAFAGQALRGEPLTVFGDGSQTREWLHVDDHAEGIILATTVVNSDHSKDVFNLGPGTSECNLHIAKAILERLGKPETLISHVTDRPGHDRHYAICNWKAETKLGWEAKTEFIKMPGSRRLSKDGLDQMLDWYTGPGMEWCKKAGYDHLHRKGEK